MVTVNDIPSRDTRASCISILQIKLRVTIEPRDGAASMLTVRSVSARTYGHHRETPTGGVRKLLYTGLADTGCPSLVTVRHRLTSRILADFEE